MIAPRRPIRLLLGPALVLALGAHLPGAPAHAAAPAPAPAAPAGMSSASPSPYRDPLGRFALAFPPAWAVGPDEANTAVTAATGPAGVTVKVVAAELAAGMTLERYVAGSKAAWSAIWTVREEKPARLGALEARRLVIDQAIGRQTTRLLKYFAGDAAHVYVLTAAAPPSAFERHLPAFEAIAATFAPGDWAAANAPAAASTHAEPRFTLALPAGWRLASRLANSQVIWKKKDGGQEGTVRVRFTPRGPKPATGLAKAAIAEEKATFDGDAGWTALAEGPMTLGGAPGLRLVSVYRADGQAEYEAFHAAERDGDLVTLSCSVDAEAPSPALRADFDAVVAGFRWR